jgi:hypothetical protein
MIIYLEVVPLQVVVSNESVSLGLAECATFFAPAWEVTSVSSVSSDSRYHVHQGALSCAKAR